MSTVGQFTFQSDFISCEPDEIEFDEFSEAQHNSVFLPCNRCPVYADDRV